MRFPMIRLGSVPRKMRAVPLDFIGFEENATFP
jgi:hypothetical protein